MCTTILIPAVGEGRRFKDAGINIPKGLIRFSYKNGPVMTMIEHCLSGLKGFNILVGVRSNKKDIFTNILPSNMRIVSMSPTKGQSCTIRNMCLFANLTSSLLIINSDNAFDCDLNKFLCSVYFRDIGAIVFKGHDNKSYSYINKMPNFTYAEEKDPISPWALAGAYYVKIPSNLVNAIDLQIDGDRKYKNEFYLSQCFGFMSGEKLAIPIKNKQLISWGTPEELFNDPNVSNIISD